jgi:sterol 3beta-glucosyltransferase
MKEHDVLNITIVTSGSRGDVQPYVALGRGLKRAGYGVRLLASADFGALATGAGLAFASTGPNIEQALQSEEWRRTLEQGNFVVLLRKMQAEMKRLAAPMVERLPDLLRGSDLILTGMAGMAGVFAAAEYFDIPLIQAYVVPFSPTAAFPSPVTPNLPLGGPVNRLSFHLMRQMFWQNSKAVDVTLRQELGMRRGSWFGPFRWLDRRRVPVLYGYSRHVLPRPADWDGRYHVTGYWFLDEPAGWTPPDDLVTFLQAGSPPVYIGFGSMAQRNPAEAGRLALAALERSGQRGVLAAGWGGLRASDVPGTVHLISSMPHSWLFPRMAAVVHHGGAGTTAAGLRAGVPSIIVPFGVDQPFWGRRVAQLGVGPAPIPRKQLTAERLAAAITQAVSDDAMRRSAAVLGQNIAQEDGIASAVAFVDRFRQSMA